MIVLNFVIPTIIAVLIALFDDIAVLLIAYDYAIFSQSPEKWHAKQFFFTSFLFGLLLVVSSFIWYAVGLEVFNLPVDILYSLIFLEISITSILFIFIMRTPTKLFFTLRTKAAFVSLVILALIFCTFFCGFGWLIPAPLPWQYVGYTWLYSLGYLLVLDFFKVALFAFYTNVLKWAKSRHMDYSFFKRIIRFERSVRSPKAPTDTNYDKYSSASSVS